MKVDWKKKLSLKTQPEKTAAVIATPEVITKIIERPVKIIKEIEVKKKYSANDYAVDSGRSVTVAATSTKILDRNEKRITAILVNDSSQAIYLKFGNGATINSGIRLNASGGNIILGRATDIPYIGEVYGIASATSVLTVIEING